MKFERRSVFSVFVFSIHFVLLVAFFRACLPYFEGKYKKADTELLKDYTKDLYSPIFFDLSCIFIIKNYFLK